MNQVAEKAVGPRKRRSAVRLAIVASVLIVVWMAISFGERLRMASALRAVEKVRTAPVEETNTLDPQDARRVLGDRLAALGDRGTLVLEYELGFRDPNWTKRRAALRRIPGIGGKLASGIRDPASVRRRAARWLGFMGESAEGSLSALLQAANDPSPRVHSMVAYAMGCIGTASPEVLRTLEALTNSPVREVQANAAVALWRLRGHDETSTGRLLDLLDGGGAYEVTGALHDLGSESVDMLPTIRASASSWNWGDARFAALSYIWRVDGDVAYVASELDDAERRVREFIASGMKDELEDFAMKLHLYSYTNWDMRPVPELRERLQRIFEACRTVYASETRGSPHYSAWLLVSNAFERLGEFEEP